MLFSSLIFLFVFLPVVIILYYLVRNEYRNRLLLIASLIFFAWGGVSYSILLIASLLINYTAGRMIDRDRGSPRAKVWLIIGVVLNLGMLGVFKYGNFVVENINYFLKWFGDNPLPDPGIILPLGISFYTFQAMSYIIDVYRKEAEVQKNFFKLALYISFFPQLIAGPIVRYQNIAAQLTIRKHHRSNFTYGIQRFVIGLSKKVLLANQFGLIADKAFALQLGEINSTTSWVGVLAYTMQIYFDFSGYSDMAIGLGRMFGFRLPENFNYPYVSRSIREFWQRWHMTLSIWFKNYLYFPLGGSRKGPTRTIINLLLVFFATSIWHGASWNFVIWGMTHGFFMMLERLGLGKIIDRLWRPFQHLYAMFIIIVTRVFFRAEGFDFAWGYFKKLYTFDFGPMHINVWDYFNQSSFYLIIFFGILTAVPFWPWLNGILKNQYKKLEGTSKSIAANTYQITETLLIIAGLFFSALMLLGDAYNPFIYFRF